MDFSFSEQEEKLRNEVRQFLKKEIPSSWVKGGISAQGEIDNEEEYTFVKSFLRKLGGEGWLGIHWPKEYGGLGRSHMEQAIFMEEMAYRGAPDLMPNVWHLAPILLDWGTEEQKRTHLPRAASGEIVWIDALAEPDAGSDGAEGIRGVPARYPPSTNRLSPLLGSSSGGPAGYQGWVLLTDKYRGLFPFPVLLRLGRLGSTCLHRFPLIIAVSVEVTQNSLLRNSFYSCTGRQIVQ